MGEFGEFTPGNEPGSELFAIERGAQQMPLEREILSDRTKARKEFLCAFQVTKAAHMTLPFARRLMAVLGPVVQPSRSFDEHVLHVRKLRDFGFGRRVAAQLISDDLASNRTGTQHTLEEAFGRGFVAPLLQ